MTRQDIFRQIREKGSFLCVGLDTDLDKVPAVFNHTEDPVFEFNKRIIDATADYCVAFKPNIAFYESLGVRGWISLEKTSLYLREKYPNHLSIADAKRGDIGNTSAMYAKAFFDNMDFDAVTVAPYMGEDSVTPFLQHKDRWAIVLALTSNKGALNFQTLSVGDKELYKKVLDISKAWGTPDNMMYVVGATQASMLGEIRKIIPDHFLLVPGVGAQGGSLQEVAKHGMNKQCGLLVNASRSIQYASSGDDFADAARAEAKKLRDEMALLLQKML